MSDMKHRIRNIIWLIRIYLHALCCIIEQFFDKVYHYFSGKLSSYFLLYEFQEYQYLAFINHIFSAPPHSVENHDSPSNSLSGVAIVTGGCTGIGYEVTLNLLKQNWIVILGRMMNVLQNFNIDFLVSIYGRLIMIII